MRYGVAAIFLVLAAGVAAGQEQDMELRVFDVSRIAAPRFDRSGPELGNPLPQARFVFDAGGADSPPFLSADSISDLVRDTVDVEVWDEGADVHGRGFGMIVVRAPPRTIVKVEKMLADLEAAAARRVLFSVEAHSLPREAYAQVAAASDPSKLDLARLGGERVASASVEAFPGHRTSVKVVNRVRYIGDYDVEIAQGSNISDPIVCQGREGFVMDLIPHATADGSRIVVQALLQQGKLDRPFREHELGVDEEYFARPFRTDTRQKLGIVQLPVYRRSDAFSTHVLASGGAFAVPVLSRDRLVVFLVRPKLLGRAGPRWMLDVGAISHRPPDHYFGFRTEGVDAYDLQFMVPGIQEGNTSPAPLLGDPEDMIDLITRNVSPASWEEMGARVGIGGRNQLFLQNEPGVLDEVWRFVKLREDVALRPVSLDLRAYSVEGTLAVGAGVSLPPNATLLAAGSVSALPGRRASVMAGSVMNYIADYDVEVAQESRIADPIIGQSFEGLVANLIPRLSTNRTAVQLDISMLLSRRTPAEPFTTGAQYLGPVDLVSEKRVVFNATVDLPVGATYTLDAGPDPKTPTRRIAVVIQAKLN